MWLEDEGCHDVVKARGAVGGSPMAMVEGKINVLIKLESGGVSNTLVTLLGLFWKRNLF